MKFFTTRLKLVEASFRVNPKYPNSEAEPGLIFFLRCTMNACDDGSEIDKFGLAQLPWRFGVTTCGTNIAHFNGQFRQKEF